MKIKKADLLQALEIVKPGLANKEVIEQATSFAFMGGNVVTYNDEISLSCPVKGLEIEGAIHADELYQLLSKLKKDEIDISIVKNELILQAGKVKAGMTLHKEVTLPLEEIGEHEKWKELPKDFNKYVRLALQACANDSSEPIMSCVHINQTGFIEGSDRYRILRCTLEEEMPVDTFLIPSRSAMEVTRLKPIKIAEGQGWIHFLNEQGTIMSCRIFEENFPDCTPFLEVEGIEIPFPTRMAAILDRAGVFSKRDSIKQENMEINLDDGKIKIKSDSDTGWFEEVATIDYSDASLTFSITPYLLKDILADTNVGILSENMMKFEGGGWVYILLLKTPAK